MTQQLIGLTYCSYRGPKFSSLCPQEVAYNHLELQPQGGLNPFGFLGYLCSDTHRHTLIHIHVVKNKKNKYFLKGKRQSHIDSADDITSKQQMAAPDASGTAEKLSAET